MRLSCISHSIKYHEIDYVALYAGAQPEFIVNSIAPSTAVFNETVDVLSELATADDVYVQMDTGEKYAMTFDVPEQTLPVREFLFESEGYYIPKSSTYFVYTWDGDQWVMRDGFTFPGTDETHDFDLSLFLPDPDGEYKIRVWQDYQYEPAQIDYAGFSVGSSAGTLSSAIDVRDGTSILTQVQSSDDVYFSYAYGPYYSEDTASGGTGYRRDRFTQYTFTDLEVNIPPTSPEGSEPTAGDGQISWTYYDTEGDPQVAYEVEVWTQPSGTGEILWDPPVGYGEETSVTYEGEELEAGTDYYARVKFSDGSSWSSWQEVTVDGGDLGGASSNSAPTDISLSSSTIDEGLDIGATVGALSTTDVDTGDTYTYTLVGGATSAFNISGDSLITAAKFDYETTSSYTITVRSTDAGELYTEKDFTITVNDIDDGSAASEIKFGLSTSGNGNLYIESGHYLVNGLGGTYGFGEGSVSKEDDGYQQVDISAVFENGLNYFSDTPYDAATEFFIGRNGYVTFGEGSGSYMPEGIAGSTVPMIAAYYGDVDTRASSITYDTTGNSQGSNQIWYDIDTVNDCVTITFDDTGYFSQHNDKSNAFQIRLWDIGGGDFAIEIRYEAIEWILTDTSTSATAGWTAGDQVNYSELPQSGNNAAMLALDTDSEATNIDHAGVWLWLVHGGQVEEWSASIPENSPAGTEVGPLTAIDDDLNDTHTFTLLDDADGQFAISESEGVYTLVSAPESSFDYEQTSSYQVQVQAVDSYGNIYTQWLDVPVANVNEAPTSLTLSNDTILEKEASGTTVGTFTTTDPDNAETFSYALVSGDTSAFSISGSTLRSAAVFNADVKDTYTITVRSTDAGGNTIEETFNIQVQSINEAPSAANVSKSTNEDTPLNLSSTDINNAFSDPDAGDELEQIRIDSLPANAQLLFADEQAVVQSQAYDISAFDAQFVPNTDWNGQTSFTFSFSDGELWSDPATWSVSVTTVNDEPSFTAGSNQTVLEDALAQTVANWATNLSAGPSNESSQSVSFDVINNNTTLFSAQPAISSVGTLTFTPAADINGSAIVTVTLSDDGGTANGGDDEADPVTFTINVTAVNDSPDAVEDEAEVRAGEQVIIDVLANDTDIEPGNLAVAAVGESTYGSVSLLDDDTILYEASYVITTHDSFTYTVTDQGGLTDTCEVSITIDSSRAVTTPTPNPDVTPAPTVPSQATPTPAPTTGDISGVIYMDADGNNKKGSTEAPVSGALVKLVSLGSDGIAHTADDATLSSLTTAADGSYAFEDLPAGTYLIQVTAPTGSTVTTANPATVNVIAGNVLSKNFGCQSIAQLRVKAYVGQDAESGSPLADVSLSLLRPGADARFGTADDVVVASGSTEADGAYVFTGLADGSYMVCAANVDGYAMSGVAQRQISISEGQSMTQPAFGYLKTGTLYVHTCIDPQLGDKPNDDNEPLPGASVTVISAGPDGILGTDDDVLITELTTDEDGNVSLGDLPEGYYRIIIDYPDGYVGESPLTRDVYIGSDGASSISVGAQPTGTIAGTVFEDANANGLQDATEQGIAGVLIQVYARSEVVSPNADLLLVEGITDENGFYSFSQLELGTYVFDNMGYASFALVEIDPEGHVSTTPGQVEVTVNTKTPSIINFGDTMTCKTTGVIWDDADQDDLPDYGETPLAGILVSIYGPGSDGLLGTGDDELITTSTTSAAGVYQFGGLADGDYRVVPDFPDGVTCDLLYQDISVADGIAADVSFGCSFPGSLSGTAFNDSNKNGAQDQNEAGIAGLTIQVYAVNPETGQEDLVATTKTGADGSWRIAGLGAGNYRIVEVTPSSLTCTTESSVSVELLDGDSGGATFGNYSYQPLQAPTTTIAFPLIFCNY